MGMTTETTVGMTGNHGADDDNDHQDDDDVDSDLDDVVTN